MFNDGLTTHVLGPIDAKVNLNRRPDRDEIELEHFDAAGDQHYLVLTPDEALELAAVLTAAARRIATRDPK